MAISTNNKLSWADIQTLYNRLNAARTKFGFSAVTVPSNPDIAKSSQVQTLNSYVNNMSNNKYLTDVAVTGVTVPSVGTLIYPLEFTKIKTTIDNIRNTCAFDSFDSSFNSSNNSFGFDSSFNSNNNGFGFNSSNNGFSSSTFSGFNNQFSS